MSPWLVALVLLAVAGVLLGAPAKPAAGEIVPWQRIFVQVAGSRWVDRAGQVQAESRFDPQARSPVGAVGIAQFMPATWKEWGHGDPTDPAAAIQANHAYMTWQEARVGGHLDPALGAYNAGLGNILKAQRISAAMGLPGTDGWLQALPRVTGTHAAETRGYIAHNQENRARIRALAKTHEEKP